MQIILEKIIKNSHQRFRSEKHKAFTLEVSKITLSAHNDRRIPSIVSTELYAYGMSNDLVCKKEENKCDNNIKV